jgi:hypothetical protein
VSYFNNRTSTHLLHAYLSSVVQNPSTYQISSKTIGLQKKLCPIHILFYDVLSIVPVNYRRRWLRATPLVAYLKLKFQNSREEMHKMWKRYSGSQFPMRLKLHISWIQSDAFILSWSVSDSRSSPANRSSNICEEAVEVREEAVTNLGSNNRRRMWEEGYLDGIRVQTPPKCQQR